MSALLEAAAQVEPMVSILTALGGMAWVAMSAVAGTPPAGGAA